MALSLSLLVWGHIRRKILADERGIFVKLMTKFNGRWSISCRTVVLNWSFLLKFYSDCISKQQSWTIWLCVMDQWMWENRANRVEFMFMKNIHFDCQRISENYHFNKSVLCYFIFPKSVIKSLVRTSWKFRNLEIEFY